ncbi:hypothetical protein VN0250_07520 [Helicobacter pylori]
MGCFVVSKKKKRFLGCFGTFFNIKKGLKSGLIGIAVKMEIHLLGGIVLDLVIRLLRGYFKIIFPLDNNA